MAGPGATDRPGLSGAGVLLALLAFLSLAGGPTADRDVAGVIGAFALAMLVVGIAWPVLAVRRVSVSATSPVDASVGSMVPVLVELDGWIRGIDVRVLDPPSPWYRQRGARSASLPHLAARRGVFPVVRIEVRSGGPLGVWSSRRTFDVPLPQPVFVAPRPAPRRWVPQRLPDQLQTEGLARSGASAGDVVRAVRPYVAGDAARTVHWPSSLRTGELVVRELEPPDRLGQAIVVQLFAASPAAEQAASDAFGLVRAVLAQGGEPLLVTHGVDGGRAERITSALQAGRQLAAAVPGVPPPAPVGWPVEVFQG